MHEFRYLIGIDLGTTTCSLSYVDLKHPVPSIQLFSIPQLTELGYVHAFQTLPSFCYLMGFQAEEQALYRLPWEEKLELVTGIFAREQGAKTPSRSIQSAKSWLCYSAANRRDPILPVECFDAAFRLSPVEVSAAYLKHLKRAWNHSIAKNSVENQLENQSIVLTVPASFDEAARTLTLEAARLAGLEHVTLLEEPQAALYSWIAQHENVWETLFKKEESILVCDIGGGTTDFSLIYIREKNGTLSFERMAVGDHLLLGGDNIDIALAHYLEAQSAEIASSQWMQLVSQARAAKEYLLSEERSLEDVYSAVVQGSGSSVIGKGFSIKISKKEILELVCQGFFPILSKEEAVKKKPRPGVRSMGLPYEDEPAITKHLAHFLETANVLEGEGIDYILFNGGTLKPLCLQKTIIESLNGWFPNKKVQQLSSFHLDLAVCRGAAYYGKVRQGLGVRIGGGSPRSYYLKVDVVDSNQNCDTKALTLLSRGSEEGDLFYPAQTFFARANQPVSFELFSSHVRLGDIPGDLVEIKEEDLEILPPIQTILRYGKKEAFHSSEEGIPVKLGICRSPMGTIEVWIESLSTSHRWNLEFQIRSSKGEEYHLYSSKTRAQDETFSLGHLDEAKEKIEQFFDSKSVLKPAQITESLEMVLEAKRLDWGPTILRGLWDCLFQQAAQKDRSLEHACRWWNLIGFCLRPGYGYPLDDFRVKELWKLILNGFKTIKDQELLAQLWICCRRISGGLNKGQQTQVSGEILPALLEKKGGLKVQKERYYYIERLRLFSSLERLDTSLKIRLGEALLAKLFQKGLSKEEVGVLGRLGARSLLYGSIADVVSKEVCGQWVKKLLEHEDTALKTVLFSAWARKTNVKAIDLPDVLLNTILSDCPDVHLKEVLMKEQPMNAQEQQFLFGEPLPPGLILPIQKN